MLRSVLSLMLMVGCQRLPPSSDVPTSDADTDTDTDTDADSDTDVDTDLGPYLRIVHWNIQFTGAVDSDEYDATVGILARLDADVVSLNEVDSDERDEFEAIAAELGYDTAYFPGDNPFGAQRNALMSRMPVESLRAWSSVDLGGGSGANDVTRYPIGVRIRPDGGVPVVLVGTHLNAGFGDGEEFRRAVDSIRTTQAALDYGDARVVVMGDLNAEEDDRDRGTDTRIPTGMPSSYRLGSDLQAALEGGGISRDPFAPMEDAGLIMVDALQLDGRDTTREESGRRLDYAWASDAVHEAGLRSEVYDPRDEGQPGGLEKFGSAPGRDDAVIASDHLPVVIEFAY